MEKPMINVVKFAAQLRQDIAAKIADGSFGELPEGFTFMVTSNSRTSSVWVTLAGVSPTWLREYGWDDFHGMMSWGYSMQAEEIMEAIEAMRSAYKVSTNADDLGRDYHEANYYGGTKWSGSIGYPTLTKS